MSMHRWLALSSLLLLFLTPLVLAQEEQSDPLNDTEVNELRETAMEPEKRLEYFVAFARARLESAEKACNNPKLSNRGAEIHQNLQDFSDIYDEMDDNVDTYADRQDDLRKALRIVIDADTEFAAKLRALKDSANVPPQISQQYQFVLSDAIESVDDSAKEHRQLFDQQETAAKEKKKEKH
jgi:hypothetical protein